MPLAPGTRLGPYEIVAAIAAGGMGEVYRARDARLQRDVAIKILPEIFASDPDRRSRFEREARAVAALSHPNILAIFDIGVHGNIAYAVTELLEGETLRERLTSDGALPLRKAVDYGAQIARGLAAAHDKGIVHRDLKPENLFLLGDGRLKILDFGIARPVVSASGEATIASSTDPGTVMGTVGYMAPEQVRGQVVDPRTDLFAFGAVLYEMISGRRAFQRDTPAETMTAILKEDPPEITDVRGPLPPGLDRIVRHCLEKAPAERFQSARDVAFAIEALSGTSTGAAEAMAASEAVRPRWRWAAAAVAIALVGIPAAFFLGRRGSSPVAVPNVTFETKTFDTQFISNARFMPDGQSIVFSAAQAGNVPLLFISRPNTEVPQGVGNAPAHLLSISSNGELAVLISPVFVNHRLYRGTLARMMIDGFARPWMDQVREADWAPNGTDIAIVHDVSGTDRLEFPAGHVLYQTTGYVSEPRVSPDGRRVAFFDHQTRYDDRGWLKVVDTTGAVMTLSNEFTALEGLAWRPDGDAVLFSATAGTGFQMYSAAASGTVAVRQLMPGPDSVVVLDVAHDERCLAVRSDDRLGIRARAAGMAEDRELGWLNRAIQPQLSPNQKLVAFTDQSAAAGSAYSVAYRSVDGGPVARLGEGFSLGFSPDGKWALGIVFSPPQRFFAYPLGPGAAVPLKTDPIVRVSWASWFPDSRRVLACGSDEKGQSRCYERPIAADVAAKAISPPGVSLGYVSPDGRTLLFAGTDGRWSRSRSGVELQPVAALTPEDTFVGWSNDSRAVYVQKGASIPARIEKVDLATGARTTVREIAMSDAAALIDVVVTDYHDDGGYAFWYWKSPSTLFVVSGLAAR